MNQPDKSREIYIQVRPLAGPVMPQSSASEFITATQGKLKEVAQLIETSLQGLVSEIGKAPNPPSEVGLEFGIDISAEGGIPFITKGSLGANFKISVMWRRAEAKG
jgi:hypothetical protein